MKVSIRIRILSATENHLEVFHMNFSGLTLQGTCFVGLFCIIVYITVAYLLLLSMLVHLPP